MAPANPAVAAARAFEWGAPGAAFGGPATGAGIAAARLAPAAIGFGARAAANRMTANVADRLGNIIRSGGGTPTTIAPRGPRVASPLAALLTGSAVNAFQPAQPYPPGLGAAFAQ